MGINIYYGSFPHSLLRTSKLNALPKDNLRVQPPDANQANKQVVTSFKRIPSGDFLKWSYPKMDGL